MSDEEFLANLKNISNEKLIQSLKSCGHDGYYNELYYPIVKEIERRLSSTSAVSERMAKVKESWGLAMCCACEKRVFPYDNYCSHCGAKLEWNE